MFGSVNLLALLALLTAGILTGIGELEPESFMLLVTGLAIPARSDGYQNVGTRAMKVEGVPGGEPVATEPAADTAPARRSRRKDAGHFDVPGLIVTAAVAVLVVVIYHLLQT